MTDGMKRIAMMVGGVTLAGVVFMAVKAARDGATHATSTRTITIDRDVERVFAAWRTLHAGAFQNFAEVTPGPEAITRWQLRPPLSASWETKLVENRADFMRWAASGPPGRFEGAFGVRPAPGNRGTEATLSLIGPVSRTIVGTTLRRFKSLVESGEAPSLESNPSGRS